MTKRQSLPRDRGAALITVLSMLAIMSALAIVVVDAADMSMRRSGNQLRMEQTRWYLMGAESFAVSRLSELNRRARTQRIDQSEWQRRPFTFPLDDGAMEIVLADGSNCFNLNSIAVSDEGRTLRASAAGMVLFARLMDIVGVRSDQGGVAAALGDWVDSDRRAMAGGAEDAPASGAGEAYRTGNTLIADVSELRRVRGIDAEAFARLAPYICVRPATAPNPLNPNTLTPEQAPLLAMAIADLSVDAAGQLIRDRPRGGWEDIDDFFAMPRLAGLELNDATRAQFSLQSSYYVLRARVEREDGRETSAVLLQSQPNGTTTVLRRVFGVGAAETLL